MKKQIKAKEPIRLRTKELSNGNQSLYLDCYFNGKRQYEFLKLYLIPEKSREDKDKNRQTLSLANAVLAKRIVELQNEGHGFKISSVKNKANVITYIDAFILKISEDRDKNKGYIGSMKGLKYHLQQFNNGSNLLFCNIDRIFLIGFCDYLKTATASSNVVRKKKLLLSQCTQWNYFNKLSFLLNKAKRENIISENPMDNLDPGTRPQRAEPRRVFLTLDEVKKLAATDIKRIEIKQAFLFSCLCGLRISDVRAMKWEDFKEESKGNILLEIVQKKTNGLLYLPISDEAMKQLPDVKEIGLVFPDLPDNSYIDILLKKWVRNTDIKKNVTFHVARHTFATLGLTYGADLYTVSKLLGHSDIKITQIYADIISEKKRDAVNAIPSLLD